MVSSVSTGFHPLDLARVTNLCKIQLPLPPFTFLGGGQVSLLSCDSHVAFCGATRTFLLLLLCATRTIVVITLGVTCLTVRRVTHTGNFLAVRLTRLFLCATRTFVVILTTVCCLRATLAVDSTALQVS